MKRHGRLVGSSGHVTTGGGAEARERVAGGIVNSHNAPLRGTLTEPLHLLCTCFASIGWSNHGPLYVLLKESERKLI